MEKVKYDEMDIDEAINRSFEHTSLKVDGTQLHFEDNHLISNRDCVRNDRYPHIVKLLKNFGVNDVVGEMFVKGGNVLDINKRENWSRALYMIFDVKSSQSLKEKQAYIEEIVKRINSPSILKPMVFATVREGWEYVVKNNQEGLVLKTNSSIYKVKKLNEAKIKIIGYESGSEKGAFLLENGGKVSATSRSFVERYNQLSKDNEVIAEIEYPFKTEDGKFFQPRLRDLIIE